VDQLIDMDKRSDGQNITNDNSNVNRNILMLDMLEEESFRKDIN